MTTSSFRNMFASACSLVHRASVRPERVLGFIGALVLGRWWVELNPRTTHEPKHQSEYANTQEPAPRHPSTYEPVNQVPRCTGSPPLPQSRNPLRRHWMARQIAFGDPAAGEPALARRFIEALEHADQP